MRATSFLLLFSVIFCCSLLRAQSLPGAPSFAVNAATVEVPPPWIRPSPPIQAGVFRAGETRIIDRKFMLLGGLVFGTTAADMQLTQHCQNAGTCVELNPTVPRALWAKYATNSATNTAVMYWAYRWKKEGKRLWWAPPLVDIGIHVVGVGSNIRFAW
jgi:hypothetical protein